MKRKRNASWMDGPRGCWCLNNPTQLPCHLYFLLAQKKARWNDFPASLVRVQELVDDYPSSSKIAFFTFVGTGEYFSGSIAELRGRCSLNAVRSYSRTFPTAGPRLQRFACCRVARC